MEMFSKELQELDRNTVRYMIDEMQNTIDVQGAQLLEKDSQLQAALAEIERLKAERIIDKSK